MKMYLNNGSVCELVYMLRDALMENNLSVAVFLAKEVHEKVGAMLLDRQKVECEIECPNGCKLKKET